MKTETADNFFVDLHKFAVSNRKLGFSLIELLVVIGIVTILAVGGTVSYLGLRDKKALDSIVSKIVFDLRATSGRSKAQEDDMGWGIRFTNSADDYYEIWRGADYATGEEIKRTNLTSMFFTDPAEGFSKDIVFARATGLPTSSAAITISSNSLSKTITVSSNGRIDY